jgi:hypothetical protein
MLRRGDKLDRVLRAVLPAYPTMALHEAIEDLSWEGW